MMMMGQMKMVRLTASGGFSTLLRPGTGPRPPFFFNPHPTPSPSLAPVAAVSSSSTSLPLLVEVPLFLRPPKYSAALSDLQEWHSWAKGLALSVKLDDGPDHPLLCRELRWLLEDAGADPASLIHPTPVQGRQIHLKAGINELYRLWRQRIEERRPFQYIVGCEHWRDLVLSVQEGVLIPRPETEVLVDLVAAVVSKDGELGEGLWADLGTGSGALAIGIARALSCNCGKVIATDLSPVAVQVASFNVQRYNLKDVVEVRQGSWLEPLKDVQGKLAGLVSNPPYIPSGNLSGLQAEVGRHEPRLALDGGVDGMDDLLHICCGAASMLRPGGYFALETNGERQCELLLDYLETQLRGSFFDVRVVTDFAGIPRFVTGFRQ